MRGHGTDKANKDLILQEEGIPAIIGCLRSAQDHVVLSALTTLDFLVSPFNQHRTRARALRRAVAMIGL